MLEVSILGKILCTSIYRRSGFDCEILMIANCEFSEARNQTNRKVSLSVLLSYGTGLTIAIIRIRIWLDKPNSQSLNYAIKTRPTVYQLVFYIHNVGSETTANLLSITLCLLHTHPDIMERYVLTCMLMPPDHFR